MHEDSETNPYRVQILSEESAKSGRPTRPPLVAWLLLIVPHLVGASILYASTWLRIGWLHLAMISVLPLAVPLGFAIVISCYLVRRPWVALALIAMYGLSLLAMAAYAHHAYKLNPFP